MYSITIEIENHLPKSLNKELRSHRFKRMRQNQEWDFMIAQQVCRQLPEKPLTKARISIVRHFHRTLDYDGLVGSMKPVVDALVTCGVLADDSWKVTGPWRVTQCFRPRRDGSLLILKVEELSADE